RLLSAIPARREAAKREPRGNVPEHLPDLHAEHAARGDTDFLPWLQSLPVTTLHSLIRANDFDPNHRTKKWKEAEKLATFIVDSLRARMSRGSAFMGKAKTDASN